MQPGMRRRGVGRALVRWCEARAAGWGDAAGGAAGALEEVEEVWLALAIENEAAR